MKMNQQDRNYMKDRHEDLKDFFNEKFDSVNGKFKSIQDGQELMDKKIHANTKFRHYTLGSIGTITLLISIYGVKTFIIGG